MRTHHTIRCSLLLGLCHLVPLSPLVVPARAQACSCRPRTVAEHLAAADLVFVGRAGQRATVGKHSVQRFEVLLPIKGQPVRHFSWRRTAGVTPPCDISYQPGQVTVIFATRGDVDRCSGNGALAEHLEWMPALLRHGGAKVGRPPAAALGPALAAVLAPYLHDRPSVPVVYRGAGAARPRHPIRIGRTALPLVTRADPKKAVVITGAMLRGDVVLITGRYDLEGYRFSVLLRRAGQRFEVLGSAGVEH